MFTLLGLQAVIAFLLMRELAGLSDAAPTLTSPNGWIRRFVRMLRLCTNVTCIRERLGLLGLLLIGLGHALLRAIDGGPRSSGPST